MILEFKSPRNTCGHREYLRIDTAARTYSTEPHFIADGAAIRETDSEKARAIIEELEAYGVEFGRVAE